MQYILGMKRSHVLQLRLTPEEKQAFEDAANIAGITLAAWAREGLRMSATQELQRVGQRAAFLRDVPLKTYGH